MGLTLGDVEDIRVVIRGSPSGSGSGRQTDASLARVPQARFASQPEAGNNPAMDMVGLT